MIASVSPAAVLKSRQPISLPRCQNSPRSAGHLAPLHYQKPRDLQTHPGTKHPHGQELPGSGWVSTSNWISCWFSDVLGQALPHVGIELGDSVRMQFLAGTPSQINAIKTYKNPFCLKHVEQKQTARAAIQGLAAAVSVPCSESLELRPRLCRTSRAAPPGRVAPHTSKGK